MTWKEHEMETLIRNLILGFKVRTAGFKPDQPLIRVKPNNNDLELTNEFEQALTDVSNFSMQANFIAQYPDLAPYIRADIRSFAPTLPPSVSLPRPTPSQPVGTQPWYLIHYGLSLGSSPSRQCSILQIPYIHHPTSILQRVTERSRRWYVRVQRYPSWVEIGTTNRSSLTHPWILSVIPEMQRLLTFLVSNLGIISILISPDHCLFLIHLSLTTPETHVLQDLLISIAGICSAVGISYKYPPRSSLVALAQWLLLATTNICLLEQSIYI